MLSLLTAVWPSPQKSPFGKPEIIEVGSFAGGMTFSSSILIKFYIY